MSRTKVYKMTDLTLKPACCRGEGEVIAFPSNVKHSAKTGSVSCKTADAWSPVRKEYLRAK